MQTLRTGCGKAEPKKFAPPQTTFPRAQDGQNLISWRQSLPLHTNPVWRGSMHAISSYHGNRPTNTHPPTHKQTGPITIYCTAASLQCNNTIKGHPNKRQYGTRNTQEKNQAKTGHSPDMFTPYRPPFRGSAIPEVRYSGGQG